MGTVVYVVLSPGTFRFGAPLRVQRGRGVMGAGDPDGVTVVEADDNFDRDNGYFFQGPYGVNPTIACGECRQTFGRGTRPELVRRIYIRCPKCDGGADLP